jgi:3-dehydroquinate synthase
MSHEDRVVRVDLAAAPYNVHVKAGLMEEIGRRLVAISPSQRAVLMTDSQVVGQWANALRSSCAAAEIELIAECIIPAGEESKNLDSVQKAYDIFLKAKIERTTPILALGGGVIGDMSRLRRGHDSARRPVRADSNHAAGNGRRQRRR